MYSPFYSYDQQQNYDKLTILRHPVDRVWSMFRFRTKYCYDCQPLSQIYQQMNTDQSILADKPDMCALQLQNHMTRNMLPQRQGYNISMTDMPAAIQQLQGFVLGMTHALEESVAMIHYTFPFTQSCHLRHANASPQNNRCGPDSTHWDLPAEPDEETRQLIIQYNALDMALYEAALVQYNEQKQVYQQLQRGE